MLSDLVNSGRQAAERLMTLTLTPYVPNGTTTVVNGQETPGYDPGRAVKGKLRGQSAQSVQPYTRSVVIGGVDTPIVEGGLHIPIGAAIPTAGAHGKGWEYVVTRVGPSDDPALLGRRYLVTNSPAMSHATARRLDVAEVPQ
jgi:hypothetical protein